MYRPGRRGNIYKTYEILETNVLPAAIERPSVHVSGPSISQPLAGHTEGNLSSCR